MCFIYFINLFILEINKNQNKTKKQVPSRGSSGNVGTSYLVFRIIAVATFWNKKTSFFLQVGLVHQEALCAAGFLSRKIAAEGLLRAHAKCASTINVRTNILSCKHPWATCIVGTTAPSEQPQSCPKQNVWKRLGWCGCLKTNPFNSQIHSYYMELLVHVDNSWLHGSQKSLWSPFVTSSTRFSTTFGPDSPDLFRAQRFCYIQVGHL